MAAEVRNCLKTGDYVGPLWTTKIVREEGGGTLFSFNIVAQSRRKCTCMNCTEIGSIRASLELVNTISFSFQMHHNGSKSHLSPNYMRISGSRWGNRRERDHWGDLGVDGLIILGSICRRWDVGIWTGLGWPRIETGGGRL